MHRNREDPMTAPKPWPRPAINEPNYVDTSDSHIFNHKGGLQLSPINGLGPASQQYQESLPEPNYMPSSSVIRGGGGGKSYLTLPGSNGYPQQPLQQFPPEQPPQLPPSSYKSILPSQWMGSNSVRSNWPMQPGDGLPSGGGSDGAPPQEQYIQPPVQQHRPVMQELQSTSNGADAASSITMQQQSVINQPAAHASGAQWGLGSQIAGSGATPTPNAVVPGAPAAPGAAAAGEESNNRAGSDTPAANNNPATGHESLPSSGATAPDSAKHKPPVSNPSGGGAEYEEDAYEDTYPESTNAAGGEEQSQPPTQTEPPKKKLRKHHKHGKQDSDLDTANEQQTEQQQKKKKKTKTIKKDKAAEHGAGSGHHAGTDPIVHEHLKALHKDLEIEFADHDGYADRPGGAMLSLTLGVLLTAAMGILLSCRMRVARRRIRRPGKSSYAHDADFLVNGISAFNGVATAIEHFSSTRTDSEIAFATCQLRLLEVRFQLEILLLQPILFVDRRQTTILFHLGITGKLFLSSYSLRICSKLDSSSSHRAFSFLHSSSFVGVEFSAGVGTATSLDVTATLADSSAAGTCSGSAISFFASFSCTSSSSILARSVLISSSRLNDDSFMLEIPDDAPVSSAHPATSAPRRLCPSSECSAIQSPDEESDSMSFSLLHRRNLPNRWLSSASRVLLGESPRRLIAAELAGPSPLPVALKSSDAVVQRFSLNLLSSTLSVSISALSSSFLSRRPVFSLCSNDIRSIKSNTSSLSLRTKPHSSSSA
uniref:Uncharacterized protein n=1 Tax=Anopheles melas TaxID=34690 RepID=A0A182UJU3_9DIPT